MDSLCTSGDRRYFVISVYFCFCYKSKNNINHSVMFNSLHPLGLQPTRLLFPWNSPGKNTAVGCHFFHQGIFLAQGSNTCLLCLLHWWAGSILVAPTGNIHLQLIIIFNVISQLIYSGFSSVAQSCQTLCDPMNRSTPGLPVHHQLPESTQTHVHRVGDAIQPAHPLSSSSPTAPNPSQH